MDPLVWHQRPSLHRPILLIAFEGWNDAGDAASRPSSSSATAGRRAGRDHRRRGVLRLHRHPAHRRRSTCDSTPARSRGPTRSCGRVGAEARREILLILVGNEPHLKWRTFCSQIIHRGHRARRELVVHPRRAAVRGVPTPGRPRSSGTADDADLMEQLGLRPSTLRGADRHHVGVHHALPGGGHPVGLAVGRGADATCRARRRRRPPSPSSSARASLLGPRCRSPTCEIATAAYERQIDELVEADEETAAYVGQLEERRRRTTTRTTFAPLGRDPEGHPRSQEVERFLDEPTPTRLSSQHPQATERLSAACQGGSRGSSKQAGAGSPVMAREGHVAPLRERRRAARAGRRGANQPTSRVSSGWRRQLAADRPAVEHQRVQRDVG